jgi:hypothetical protein
MAVAVTMAVVVGDGGDNGVGGDNGGGDAIVCPSVLPLHARHFAFASPPFLVCIS